MRSMEQELYSVPIVHCITATYFTGPLPKNEVLLLYDFSVTVKAAPHECVIRTGQP